MIHLPDIIDILIDKKAETREHLKFLRAFQTPVKENILFYKRQLRQVNNALKALKEGASEPEPVMCAICKYAEAVCKRQFQTLNGYETSAVCFDCRHTDFMR